MTKLLKILFFILIAITVVEAGIYAYLLRERNFFQRNPNNQNIKNQTIVSSDQMPVQYNQITEQIINTGTVGFYQRLIGRKNQKLTVEFIQDGVVKDIKYEQDGDMMPYITLADETGIKLLTMVIDDSIIFYKSESEELIPMPFNKVQVGDKISMKQISDLIDPSKSSLEFIIY